jgi:hypothetical protein
MYHGNKKRVNNELGGRKRSRSDRIAPFRWMELDPIIIVEKVCANNSFSSCMCSTKLDFDVEFYLTASILYGILRAGGKNC